jgi:hypothetical protein
VPALESSSQAPRGERADEERHDGDGRALQRQTLCDGTRFRSWWRHLSSHPYLELSSVSLSRANPPYGVLDLDPRRVTAGSQIPGTRRL